MRVLTVLALGLTGLVATAHAAAQQTPALPTWAYPMNPAPPAPAPAGGGAAAAPAAAAAPQPKMSLPGTALTFTRQEITGQTPADWFPGDHPAMPPIVATGRTDVRACALCHYPNGQGRPENGPVSGMPAVYIVQQLVDFQNGTRKSSEPLMGPPANMVRLAKAMTPEEMAESAAYFASFPYRRWIRVVEAATVPKLSFEGGMFVPAAGTEPIGNRIVEVPEDAARTGLRDPRSGFVAYVQPGSLAKGKALVESTANGRTACAACHGADLRGIGPVPPIAGRAASYLMRQLVDFKTGARAGAWSGMMKPVVDKLSEEEMMFISGYVASQQP